MKFTRCAIFFGLILSLLFLEGCMPVLHYRGQLLKAEDIAKLKVGYSTMEDVQALISSPSFKAPFNKNVWIYSGEETKTYAFLQPEVLARETYVLTFNEGNILESLRRVNPGESLDVIINANQTPVRGHEVTNLQQMFRNFQKFKAPDPSKK